MADASQPIMTDPTAIPDAVKPDVVYAQWKTYLGQLAANLNSQDAATYHLNLANWKLNAPIRAALGLTPDPKPTPGFALVVNFLPDGTVGDPNFLRSDSVFVCAPEQDAPSPALDPTPRLGTAMGNGRFAVPAGDESPAGTEITVAGVDYIKRIISSITGEIRYYEPVQ